MTLFEGFAKQWVLYVSTPFKKLYVTKLFSIYFVINFLLNPMIIEVESLVNMFLIKLTSFPITDVRKFVCFCVLGKREEMMSREKKKEY